MNLNHQQISFVKSFVRIVGYLLLIPISALASTVLVLSELIGIVEEVGY